MKEWRREYSDRSLRREDLGDQPLQQVHVWLHDAAQAGVVEPNAVVLATATREGRPSSRTVIVKAIDDFSLIFNTNYGSRKAQELDANPQAAATFLWKELERQVTVEGRAERLSDAATMALWMARPRGSQLGAWASRQDEVIKSRDVLEAQLKEAERLFQGKEVPVPDGWGGYRLVVERVEFWQGRRNRLHDRFQYQLDGKSWRIERLSP